MKRITLTRLVKECPKLDSRDCSNGKALFEKRSASYYKTMREIFQKWQGGLELTSEEKNMYSIAKGEFNWEVLFFADYLGFWG